MPFSLIEPQPKFFRNIEAERLARSYTTKPNDLQLRADDDCIGDMKACGAFYDLDFFHLYGTHTVQGGALNWIDSNRYFATITSTFTKHRQVAGNGSTTFADSNFDPTTAVSPKFQRDDCCIGMFLQNTGTNAVGDAGNSATLQISGRLSVGSGNCVFVRMNCTTPLDTGAGSAMTAFGLTVGDRSASNLQRAYRNGVQLGSDSTTASEAVPAGNITFGKVGAGFSTRAFTIGFAGRSMSAARHLALYAAISRRLKVFGASP